MKKKKTILEILTRPVKLVGKAKDDLPGKKSPAFRPYKPHVVQNVAKKAENDLGRVISELS